MQIAIQDNSFDCKAWLAINTAFCQRHRCSLTAVDCDKQRVSSQAENGDLRCQGCGGLDNQPEAIDEIGVFGKTTPHLQLVRPIQDDKAEREIRSINPLTRAFVAALQEILDGDEWVDEEPIDDLDDDEPLQCIFSEEARLIGLDPLTEFLLSELQGYDEKNVPELGMKRGEICDDRGGI